MSSPFSFKKSPPGIYATALGHLIVVEGEAGRAVLYSIPDGVGLTTAIKSCWEGIPLPYLPNAKVRVTVEPGEPQ